MRILVLLFLIITLILFCILFRFYFYKKLQDIIRIKFNKFNFVYGMKFLSVQNFSAENDNENMKVQTAYVSFKNVFGFKRFTTIFFADNIELNILNISKKDKNVQKTLDQWIKQKLVVYSATFFFKCFNFTLTNVKITYNGFSLLIKRIKIKASRNNNDVNGLLILKNIIFYSGKEPLVWMPSYELDLHSSSNIIRLFLTNKLKYISIRIPELVLSYSEGLIQCHYSDIDVTNQNKEKDYCKIKGSNFVFHLPIPDLYTQFCSFTILNLFLKKNYCSVESIVATRNDEPLLKTKNIEYSEKNAQIPFLDVTVATPLIIDIGLIIRKVLGSADFDEKQQLSAFAKYSVHLKSVITRICFSDNHIIQFSLGDVNYKNMYIKAKEAIGNFVFDKNIYKFGYAEFAELGFAKPYFAVKAHKMDLYLDNNFPENNFLQELFCLGSWIENQFRGKVAFGDNRNVQSPSRRIYSFDIKKAAFYYLNKEITSKTHQFLEAKRAAMEALILRQSKSVSIMKAKNIVNFNEKEFYKQSKKMLFQYFREALNTMPEMEKYMFSMRGNNVSVVLNGPGIKNKEEALDKMKSIEPDLDKDTVGRVTGGLLEVSANSIALDLPHIKDIIELTKISGNGFFLTSRKKGINRKDYYHFKISTDRGFNVFDVPQISSPSVTFVKVGLKGKSGLLKLTPVQLETFQDTKLNTTIYRLMMVQFQRLAFIDNCRIRFRAYLQANLDKFFVQYNDVLRAYAPSAFAEAVFPNADITFDGTSFHMNHADSLTARLLSRDCMKRVAIFHEPVVLVSLPSFNHLNPSGKRPVFIPVDSSKILDKTYDPFKKYRTEEFHTYVHVKFNNDKYASIYLNCEEIQSLVDEFLASHSILDLYRRPILFLKRFQPRILYTHTEVCVDFPPMSISMFNDSLSLKLYGSTIFFSVHNKNFVPTVNVSFSNINIPILINSNEIAKLHINNFIFSLKGTQKSIKTDFVSVQIIMDSIKNIVGLEIYVHLAKKKIEKLLPDNIDFKNKSDIIEHFNNKVFDIDVSKIDASLFLQNQESPDLEINNFCYSILSDSNNCLVNVFNFDNLMVKLSSRNKPLLSITDFSLYLSIVTNLIYLYSSLNESIFYIELSDAEIFSEIFNELTFLKMFFLMPKKDTYLRSFILRLNSNYIKISFSISESILISSEIIKFSSFLHLFTNFSCIIEASINGLRITDEFAKDSYHEMFRNFSDYNFFQINMVKERKLMKCPVYKKIEVAVQPFVIRIPVPLIKKLIKIFPTVELLQLFAFDNEMDDFNEDFNEDIFNKEHEMPSNDSNAVFIQEFRIYPFNAELNLRRKDSGAFKEFSKRALNYKGLHLFDIFGSKEQIVLFVKKNVKWAAIKALPSLVFRNNRKVSTISHSSKQTDINDNIN